MQKSYDIPLGQFVKARTTRKESINGIIRIVWRKGELVFIQGLFYPSPDDMPEIMLGLLSGNVESVSIVELQNEMDFGALRPPRH